MNIVLHQQYYVPNESKRRHEIFSCLKKNLRNPCISEIVIWSVSSDLKSAHKFVENYSPMKKITFKVPENNVRLTYKDWLESTYAQKKMEIHVLSNSDIMLDQSVNHFRDLHQERYVFGALTRYNNFNLNESPEMTQDTWSIRSDDFPTHSKSLYSQSNFSLGTLGCDNRIAFILEIHGYKIINPCLTIATHHLHESKYRTYRESERLLGSYKFIKPSSLTKSKELNPSNQNTIECVFRHDGLYVSNAIKKKV